MWEDLFQEFYLAFIDVSESTILKFHSQDKLIYLGSLVIRNVHSHRGYVKRTDKGRTSNLFESCNLMEVDVRMIDEPKSTFDQLNETVSMNDFKIMLADLYKRDWFMHDVFMMSNTKSINELSKQTTINRKYLTDARKQAQYFLKSQINSKFA